ncbi:inorganic phosphate transporter [Bacillus sp. P2(2020)]|uniref:Inorganic phosphate transporter n=1 Tax=Calidifontibacillus erzurumensis TaxID=2741433 RepID=A0A8J8GFL3_9BACI|nr:inorganic phosphate transporter [Calidifontibacillus erzurumensis]
MTYLAIIIALFFALNIGGSGAAAAISVAYGSGAIKSQKKALILCGLAIFAGAVIGGSEVVKTIGTGIIPQDLLSVKIVLIILFSAAISLFIANLLGIPLSTSEITVGAVVGVGIAYKALYINNILVIISFWLLVPGSAFVIAIVAGKFIQMVERKFPKLKRPETQRIIAVFVIIIGFFEAFSAGMNNVANAIGPLVGGNIISIEKGIILGGLFTALGVVLLGKHVMETNGKKITRFSLLEGGAISGTGAFLVILSSICGLPVPLTQVTSTAIMGIAAAQKGASVLKKNIISKILKVWIVSPIFSLVISYGLVKVVVDMDIYSLFVLLSVCASTLGVISLLNTIKEEKRVYQENGGGI